METVEDRIAALEADVAELRAYVPMLERIALFERWSNAGSVPQALLRLEEWTRVDSGFGPEYSAPEFVRPAGEASGQALQDAYDRRTSLRLARVAS